MVVNGGYFLIDKNPAEHVGLLHVNNKTISPALKSLIRNNKRYYAARGALGFLNNGNIDIAWVTSKNDSLFHFPEPVENFPDNPNESFLKTLDEHRKGFRIIVRWSKGEDSNDDSGEVAVKN